MRLALIFVTAGLCLGGADQGAARVSQAAARPAAEWLVAFDVPRGWRLIGDASNPFRASSIIATSRHIMHGSALPPRCRPQAERIPLRRCCARTSASAPLTTSRTTGSSAIPMCDVGTSTCTACGSRQARQSMIPSRRE